jgi:sec-independent protein translocase protein TatB
VFGIGLPEVAVIIVVAVIVFGPDRLPEFARQAGRLVRQVRTLAHNAQDELRRELGPEYADLKLTDLDPRVAIRKHILEAMDDDGVPTLSDRLHRDVLGTGERPPYDPDAT